MSAVKRVTTCVVSPNKSDNLELPNLERPMGPDKHEYILPNDFVQPPSQQNEVKHVRFSTSPESDVNNNNGGRNSRQRGSFYSSRIRGRSNGVKILEKHLNKVSTLVS